jgi:ATP-dependent DNA ligase
MPNDRWPFRPPITPMEARVRETFPRDEGWAFEPKWDGFRIVAWGPDGENGGVRLDSRNQRPLLRYFPELEAPLHALPPGAVVDGEVVVITNGVLDFDALSQRIHPAESRINLLAEETPAAFVAFDLLAVGGEDLRARPYHERRERLVELMASLDAPWQLTPTTTDLDTAREWFEAFEAAGCDGIVAKRLDDAYAEGERRMLKIKHRRSVDTVVGGYRLHKDGDKIGALLLGMYDEEGQLHFVGHTSSFSAADRTAMLAEFQQPEAESSFGEQARRPEHEHRWSGQRLKHWVPVAPIAVAEVSHDQITGRRFRHASRFLRWRPDKNPLECSLDQLDVPSGPTVDDVVRAGA